MDAKGQPSQKFNYTAGKPLKWNQCTARYVTALLTVEQHDLTPNVHKNTQNTQTLEFLFPVLTSQRIFLCSISAHLWDYNSVCSSQSKQVHCSIENARQTRQIDR